MRNVIIYFEKNIFIEVPENKQSYNEVNRNK